MLKLFGTGGLNIGFVIRSQKGISSIQKATIALQELSFIPLGFKSIEPANRIALLWQSVESLQTIVELLLFNEMLMIWLSIDRLEND